MGRTQDTRLLAPPAAPLGENVAEAAASAISSLPPEAEADVRKSCALERSMDRLSNPGQAEARRLADAKARGIAIVELEAGEDPLDGKDDGTQPRRVQRVQEQILRDAGAPRHVARQAVRRGGDATSETYDRYLELRTRQRRRPLHQPGPPRTARQRASRPAAPRSRGSRRTATRGSPSSSDDPDDGSDSDSDSTPLATERHETAGATR